MKTSSMVLVFMSKKFWFHAFSNWDWFLQNKTVGGWPDQRMDPKWQTTTPSTSGHHDQPTPLSIETKNGPQSCVAFSKFGTGGAPTIQFGFLSQWYVAKNMMLWWTFPISFRWMVSVKLRDLVKFGQVHMMLLVSSNSQCNHATLMLRIEETKYCRLWIRMDWLRHIWICVGRLLSNVVTPQMTTMTDNDIERGKLYF